MASIEKTALVKGFEAIEKEAAGHVPCFPDRSGYIPMVDHTVPPNVPLENHIHTTLNSLRSHGTS